MSESFEMTRDDVAKIAKNWLSEKRYQHVLRVEATAIELAKRYGVDQKKAGLCGLAHDLCKEWSHDKMVEAVRLYGLDEEMIPYGSAIMHGPLAAEWLKREAGIKDESIYKAIYQHTIGGKEMDNLSRVLFIADYIEPARQFKGVEEARLLAEKSLKAACDFKITHTLQYLIHDHKLLYPEVLEIYNAQMILNQEKSMGQ
ncbi:HD domain-containing protein [Atopobacter sp. AH10]|uniref:bis(5'-nucleosyl)-tetraphosphatase (symmetrical) YqeK n=1 Tax=Atopobacter sp. AH10 TaxID=2315861 RepID=UPI000EF1A582|nr:bis(5'-nucleosyl)-tetraphosphatase (symmetrical) YqeK [Atopobacter sp. AH10]RLK62927.1 HD domain-containing protein [Atopobacter sp. AH10]